MNPRLSLSSYPFIHSLIFPLKKKGEECPVPLHYIHKIFTF
ncbi:hypothetical protein CLOBOL_06497 [Enterocloster bolteae ATCC BAA-613]|uniref:Uncharacterized protein n=1 Tax=Enterocloster bolteae (strain ATCC BAA-613 / DSM 15670 / CCUG 46953 / JCM 12243 / WAL 16351) TaxID=411902 RepID=A8S354_ENTBW|nr:hypothetical protein CLOBOL_06497 [Enterocloster bolteae ATCC BAA-613]